MICLSLTGATLKSNLELFLRHSKRVDMAELRIDLLNPDERGDAHAFPGLLSDAAGRHVPTIATVRRAEDGGGSSVPEEERLKLLSASTAGKFAYIDLEADLRQSDTGRKIASDAARAGFTVIRSVHMIDGIPSDPARMIRELSDDGREVAKIASTPKSTADICALLESADSTHGVPRIIIGMGPFGTATRILSRRFGSLLTFVSDSGGVQAAPGHLGPEEMDGLYRFHEINANTRFFAVIGSPIAHSASPSYHNSRFAADRMNARYVPFLVDDVDAFMKLAEKLPLAAFSVTIPHKESILTHISDCDEAVAAIGSCNTVLRQGNRWHGINTDVAGFTAPLLEEIKGETRGLGALVIGAGGASRAVAYGLLKLGMRVLVLNRNAERARSLVGEFSRGQSIEAGELLPSTDLTGHRDVIVQTTSVGMHGNGDPVPWLDLTGKEVVFDIVYTPPDTPIIRRAREAGCITITGDRMFDAQADAQYRLFTPLVSS